MKRKQDRRNDITTIETSVILVRQNQSTIYKIITQSIQDHGKSYKELMNDITTFIFDVDGVLTDSSV
jgi:3-deoxy-D-manno-octulosonate 8-phosphate phosphatase KdsC-like HAD superfamily phosphatase